MHAELFSSICVAIAIDCFSRSRHILGFDWNSDAALSGPNGHEHSFATFVLGLWSSVTIRVGKSWPIAPRC